MKKFPPWRILILMQLGALPALAGDGEEKLFLREFFQGQVREFAQVFQDAFLKAVPPSKIEEVRALYLDKLGRFQEASGGAGSYQLLFEKGKAPCRIHFDSAGKVDGFWLGQWTFFDDTPEKLIEEFKALPGTVSLALVRGAGELRVGLQADRPLAVGSAFKLYVLKALADRVAAGRATFDQVLRLDPIWRSRPSGVLQDWPPGTPVTLAALANLMISISDNTATDHLMGFLGREALEAVAPPGCRPFLSTMEMFRLKSGDPARAEAFARADPAARRAMLANLSKEAADPGPLRSSPFLVDTVEWFVSARELCRVMFELKDQPALGINPGLVRKETWHKACFKGGSEPGVLNYTQLLQKTATSPVYCLAATVVDAEKPVDSARFTELVLRLLGLIERGAFDGK